MVTSISPLILGVIAFVLIGGAWMMFYWRIVDPFLRRILGWMMGVTINRGDQQIWVADEEAEDSMSWRAVIIRPMQMISMFAAGLIALTIGLVIIVWVGQ